MLGFWLYVILSLGMICLSCIFELMERAEMGHNKIILALFVIVVGMILGNYIRIGVML